MGNATDLSATIVEDLYCEALMLADDVRAAFDLSTPRDRNSGDMLRLALSTEGLKTTTRVMHALAWLLNQRAFFRGEMTEYQLERHGRLPPDREPEPHLLEMLELPTQLLIAESRTLHARIARLDDAWGEKMQQTANPIDELQSRLERALGRL
ncbi:DUF1465 family protein [Parerythrobacter jejuensis]|uniref:DUF1465 family protein n=1 Tax=Parerythrobacter jejuensis TaxID=795812 RepID=A0A845AQL4_9SPHN|nr:DUF1465 family protein [Parerythrobacter jejuensis]MXP31473.1 DUF1465 family protein [Parerythrobacter jejuensis]